MIRKIDGLVARELVAEGAQLVDVRTPDEYADRRLEGSVNLPLQTLPASAEGVLDPAAPVVLFCRSGRRSAAAGEILLGQGYVSLYDLGSIDAW